MPSVKVRDAAGAEQGSMELDEAWFGIEPNVAVLHQVVTAQLAARRAGTQSTKTRAEVRGGGAKPWKQKGTGRARQGSIRSPQWTGGGVALGPKPRSYAQRTPKKMIRLALRSALSDRAADGKVLVVDEWGFEAPSTKAAAALLASLEVDGRVLVVVAHDDDVAVKSFRNLPEVHLLDVGELNAYDILVADYVVFSRATVPGPDADSASTTSTTPTAASATKASASKKTASKASGSKASASKATAAKTSAATKATASKASASKATATKGKATKPTAGASAASRATVADAPAASAPPAESESVESDGSDEGGDIDMATDLPNRPKPTGEATKPADPSERLKPAGEKADPRFEAARVKAEKEAEVRARQQAASDAPEGDAPEGSADDEDAADEKPATSGGGFSFNQTVQSDEDDS
jgi:large subunit ribosomal protein L4